jgi:hypothetical protein
LKSNEAFVEAEEALVDDPKVLSTSTSAPFAGESASVAECAVLEGSASTVLTVGVSTSDPESRSFRIVST